MPLAYVSLFVIGICIVSAVGYFAGKTYASEIYFKRSIDAIRTNDGREVYTNLQKAVQVNPYIEKYRNQFAQMNLLLANNIARKENITDDERKAAGQFVQQSIAEAKALVALNPNRASNWNTLAVIYRNIINVAQGADAWTVASYQEAIKHDPANPLLHLNLGGVFYGAKNYEGSTMAFERAVSLKPDWANAHYNYAWSLFQQGKTAQAVAVMQNVLTLLDKNSDDYKTAQTNFDVFKDKLDAESTESAKLKPELQEMCIRDRSYTVQTLVTFSFHSHQRNMGLLRIVSRYLIIATVFLFPLFFLPFTQEFFVTQKFYLMLFSSLLILSCISASILISRKFHTINTPFIRIVLALLVVRTVSLVFASTNRIPVSYTHLEGIGIGLGALMAFSFDKGIRQAFLTTMPKVSPSVLVLLTLNEILSLAAKWIVFLAVLLGPVALVDVVVSVQIFYAIITGWLLTRLFPKIFQENISRKGLTLKLFAGLTLMLGIYLIA